MRMIGVFPLRVRRGVAPGLSSAGGQDSRWPRLAGCAGLISVAGLPSSGGILGMVVVRWWRQKPQRALRPKFQVIQHCVSHILLVKANHVASCKGG